MEKLLSGIVREWVAKNKKEFWKYEVSCFFKTYKITINNLPNPAAEDISVSPKIALQIAHKTQLSNAIKKALLKSEPPKHTRMDLKVDFINEAVVAAVV
jgi:hypothetical protein